MDNNNHAAGSKTWTRVITKRQKAKGKRRNALEQAFLEILEQDLEYRILPFDTAAANEAAKLAAKRQKEGRTIDFRDTQIAAIVQTRKATLATRNIKHFPDLGSKVINPWVAER